MEMSARVEILLLALITVLFLSARFSAMIPLRACAT